MQLTYLEAIRQGIWEEMDRDPSVFCLGEDIGIYGGAFKVTDGFIDRFGPERVIDTPIAESAIVGAAFGASLTGMRPVAEFQFMDFIGCAFNQISNMVAKTHYLWGAPAPLVLRGPSGGYVHGGPFHSQNPEMWFVHNPGLKVICPATPYDAKGLIKAAIRDNNPCIFFEHKYLYRRIKGEVPAEDYVVPIGKANIVRGGRDLSIITYAATVHTALEAAEVLKNEGIDLEILDLRTVSPLDREAIAQTVKKTNKVIMHLGNDRCLIGTWPRRQIVLRDMDPHQEIPPPTTRGAEGAIRGLPASAWRAEGEHESVCHVTVRWRLRLPDFLY